MTTTSFDRPRARRACALLAAALVFAAALPTARAQGQDEAAARALFNEGRKLQQAGHLDEACAKFDAARKMYASPGVLLNIADCHERQHRTATAWTEFADAATAATNASRPKEAAEAKRRQEALEPMLSRLEVHVRDAVPGQVVRRDGLPVTPAAWSTAIPVDPGPHRIQSEAEGRLPFSTTVDVEEPGKTVTVEVPKLDVAPPLAPAARAEPSGAPAASEGSAGLAPHAPETPGKSQRVVGLVLGGVGVAGLGAAGILALVAKSEFNGASAETTNRTADSTQAVHLADAATIALTAGAGFAAAGVIVFFTAPKAPVTVGTTGRGLFVAGSFP